MLSAPEEGRLQPSTLPLHSSESCTLYLHCTTESKEGAALSMLKMGSQIAVRWLLRIAFITWHAFSCSLHRAKHESEYSLCILVCVSAWYSALASGILDLQGVILLSLGRPV